MDEDVQVALCPSVEVFLSGEGDLYLLPTPDKPQVVVPAPLGRPLDMVLRMVDGGFTVDAALRVVPDDLADEVGGYCEALAEAGYLVPAERFPSGARDGRYDRQARYFAQLGAKASEVQASLARSAVVVLGMGGFGGAIAEQLCRMGVGRLVGVDADVVALENLPRQTLYTPEDVGQSKVDAAAARLRQVGEAEVFPVRQRVSSADHVRELLARWTPDVLVVAADSPPVSLKEWSDEACFEAGVPYVAGGQRPPYVYVGPSIVPGTTPCFSCYGWYALYEEQPALAQELDLKRDAGSFTVPAVGYADQIGAGMLVSEIVALVTKVSVPATLGRQLQIDMRTLDFVWQETGRHECVRCARRAGLSSVA